MTKLTAIACLFISVLIFMTGCDPIARHKVLSTVFDGVPALPPPEQMCEEYADKRVTAFKDQLSGKASAEKDAVAGNQSVHPPYEEKLCDDCHDKTQESGFKRPVKELCYMCHTDFIKGDLVHGPVAVADCLSCHVPHDSNNPSLLKEPKNKICGTCHREDRVAKGLHDNVALREIVCTDCHNPHYGKVQYFLK